MKTKVILGVLGVIALIVALSAGGWAWRYYTAEIRGTVSAEEQIESAPSRIANYEHFYDLCATIQGNEQAIRTQKRLLKSAEGSEAERIRSNLAGLQAQRARNIAQYNADARKAYTRARFLGEDLPKGININNGGNTQCESYQ